ncbi:MAG: TraB/GumN family protein [Acidobacteria bacterium]|nr:TraB/GumN family protein [Acidobacteriota bacterium]
MLVALLSAATIALQAAAPTAFLWKATGAKGGTVFLAGSVHLLSDEYYPLARAFDEAFAQSDLLVEEVDLAEMLSRDAQMVLLQRGMLPAGQTLERTLSPDTMTAVRAKVTDLGLPLQPLQQFKPWSLALTLQGLEWQKAGFNAELGLDRHFYDLARARGIGVQGLETLEFQIAQFDSLPMPLQDRMLAQTLKELDTEKDSVAELARAWKAGDAAAIEKVVLGDLQTEPQMYQRLLVARNNAWLPKIEALFARPKPALVVVGAAHLVGKDGLVAQLRAKGYTVVQQ